MEYECVCGKLFSDSQLVLHVQADHLQLAVLRFVEEIKKIIHLEELKNLASNPKLVLQSEEKGKLHEKDLNTENKQEESKTTKKESVNEISDEGETDRKIYKKGNDEKVSKKSGRKILKKDDRKAPKKEDDKAVPKKEDDRTVSKKEDDRKVSEKEDNGKAPKKEEVKTVSKKENGGNISKKEKEMQQTTDSQILSSNCEQLLRYRCPMCDFHVHCFTAASDHISKVHSLSSVIPRKQMMTLKLNAVSENYLQPDIENSPRTRSKLSRSSRRKSSRILSNDRSVNKAETDVQKVETKRSEFKTDEVKLKTECESEAADLQAEKEEDHIDELLKDDVCQITEKLEEDLKVDITGNEHISTTQEAAKEMEERECVTNESDANYSNAEKYGTNEEQANGETTSREKRAESLVVERSRIESPPNMGTINILPATDSSDEEEDCNEDCSPVDSLCQASSAKTNLKAVSSGDDDANSETTASVGDAILSSLEENVASSSHGGGDKPSKSRTSKSSRELGKLTIAFHDDHWNKTEKVLDLEKTRSTRKAKKKVDSLNVLLSFLLEQLMEAEVSKSFSEPIDESFAPGYSDVIKEPMDFSCMEYKLVNKKYQSVSEFRYDLSLIYSNGLIYNPEGCTEHCNALELRDLIENLMSPARLKETPLYHDLSKSEIGLDILSEAEVQVTPEKKTQNAAYSSSAKSPASGFSISERVKLRQQSADSKKKDAPVPTTQPRKTGSPKQQPTTQVENPFYVDSTKENETGAGKQPSTSAKRVLKEAFITKKPSADDDILRDKQNSCATRDGNESKEIGNVAQSGEHTAEDNNVNEDQTSCREASSSKVAQNFTCSAVPLVNTSRRADEATFQDGLNSSISTSTRKRLVSELSGNSSDTNPNSPMTSSHTRTKGMKRKRKAIFTRKKKRKVTETTAEEDEQDDVEDDEDEDWFYEDGTWIQCCLCAKWRFLGTELGEDYAASMEYWDCSMNQDHSLNKCSFPEEEWDTGHVKEGGQDDLQAGDQQQKGLHQGAQQLEGESRVDDMVNQPLLQIEDQIADKFDKPKLTHRTMIILAKQCLERDLTNSSSQKDGAAFISLVFPYYNLHHDECLKIVRKWHREDFADAKLTHTELVQLKSLLTGEEKGRTHACAKLDLLKHLIEVCNNPKEMSGNEKKGSSLPWGAKELLFLGLIAMDMPMDLLQVKHFLCLNVPGVQERLVRWEQDISTIINNLYELDNIQDKESNRMLYRIKLEYKNQVKALLQSSGGGVDLSASNTSITSSGQSCTSPALAVSIPPGIQIKRNNATQGLPGDQDNVPVSDTADHVTSDIGSSGGGGGGGQEDPEASSLPDANQRLQCPLPLDLLAYLQVKLARFDSITMESMVSSLRKKLPHLSDQYIETYLMEECDMVVHVERGKVTVPSRLRHHCDQVLDSCLTKNNLQLAMQFFSKEEMSKITRAKKINRKPKILAHNIDQERNQILIKNKTLASSWKPTCTDETLLHLAISLVGNYSGAATRASVETFINLNFPYFMLTRTAFGKSLDNVWLSKSPGDLLTVSSEDTLAAMEVIKNVMKKNKMTVPFMVRPDLLNKLLPSHQQVAVMSSNSFPSPPVDLSVLVSLSLLLLGRTEGGWGTLPMVAQFVHLHFPHLSRDAVQQACLEFGSPEADRKVASMFQLKGDRMIRLNPDRFLSTYLLCQTTFSQNMRTTRWMRCPNLINLILDLHLPLWTNFFIAEDPGTDPDDRSAHQIRIRSQSDLVSASSSTSESTGRSTTNEAVSAAADNAVSHPSALPRVENNSPQPVQSAVDVKIPPSSMLKQIPSAIVKPNLFSHTEVGQTPVPSAIVKPVPAMDSLPELGRPDIEIQVVIGMTIILYRIKEYFESENAEENTWYECFAPEWDTPLHQYILSQPFTLKQLAEWLRSVFPYYIHEENLKEFFFEFKEKKNSVLKYYFEIIENSGTELVYRSQYSRTGELFQQIILMLLDKNKLRDVLANPEYGDIILSRKVNFSESSLFSLALLFLGSQTENCRVDIVTSLLPFLSDTIGYKITGISQLEFDPSRNETERVNILSNLVDHDQFCLKGSCLAFKDSVDIPDVRSRIVLLLRKLTRLQAVNLPHEIISRFQNVKSEPVPPQIPCDYLFGLAIRNLCPQPGARVSILKVWAFLRHHFPFFCNTNFPWTMEDMLQGTGFAGPNRFHFSQDIEEGLMISLPADLAEELYEEMIQFINQRENLILESLSDPDSLWNIVYGLLPQTL